MAARMPDAATMIGLDEVETARLDVKEMTSPSETFESPTSHDLWESRPGGQSEISYTFQNRS